MKVILFFALIWTVSAEHREYVALPGLSDSTYSLNSNTYLTWEEASAECRKDGAHLAIVNSQQEMQALIDLRYSEGIDMFLSWVGFHDRFVEGDYVTMFDESLSSVGYQTWYPGYPYDSNEVNCGGILSLNQQFGLVIYTCSALRTFVCEKAATM